MPETVPHGVVVLAAGGSARLGQPKQLLCHEGETLVRRAARLALATAPSDAVIVLGAQGDAVALAVQHLPIRAITCTAWQGGMGASLHEGLNALSATCAGALILVCDQPGLDAAHLQILCNTWRANPQQGVASLYAGRRGVPALLPRGWFGDVPPTGDVGARDVLASRYSQVTVVANESLALDIDRPEDRGRLS